MNQMVMWRWTAAIFASVLILNLCGCGGGGGGGDDSPSSNPPNNALAPERISGQMIILYSGQGSRAIQFDAESGTWSENRDGITITGNYTYQRTGSGNTAELMLSEAGYDSTLALTFSTENTGSFVFVSGDSGEGTFNLQSGTGGGGGGGDDPPSDGLAPGSLAGRTIHATRTFTSTGPVGQTHVYTFSVNTFHDSDPPEESDGSYTYQPSGNNASLVFSYHSPNTFNGDRQELQMTFHSATAGIFESVYTRRDGTVIRINGTFEME